MVKTPSEGISQEIREAYNLLSEGWSHFSDPVGGCEREATARTRIEIHLAAYGDLLAEVQRKRKGTIKKRIAFATNALLDTQEARTAAIVRSMARRKGHVSPSKLISMADSFSVWQPCSETIRVRFKEKGGGKFRPIAILGPVRTAQALMVRDMLKVAGVSDRTNFAKKGSGGEKGLTQKVCTLMEEGKNWWWTPDIKSAFASMRPGHFRWLGLDRRLLLNIAFLPKCAKIEVVMPEDEEAFASYLKTAYPDLQGHIHIQDIAQLAVRRGLPQGSVLSPFLAGAFIAHLWSQANPPGDAIMLSWHDDLHVGTEAKASAVKAKEQLTHLAASLPAGPIEFHEAPVLPATSKRVQVLGYMLQPGRGHVIDQDGLRSVHIKPARKRIDRYKNNLTNRLTACDPAHREAVTRAYTRDWFNAMAAWTKVPFFSWELAKTIGITYLEDFTKGKRMGSGFHPKITGKKSAP